MLSELKFVQGSVAKKDYIPALTHFCIENGTVRGYNGTLALSSPIPFDIACKPRADKLVQAIRNCTDTIALSMTPAGRLSVKSGKFKSFIECVEGETPHVEPDGKIEEIDGEAFLAGVKSVADFVGDDASRPWSNGILVKGQSIFATNNIILVEHWTGVTFPTVVNIPRAAVKEIVRIDEPPTHAQVGDSSFTLHYANKRWIRTQVLPCDWPDLSRLLDQPSKQGPIPEGLFDALEAVKPFVDKLGRAIFHEGAVCSSIAEGDGARYEIEGLPEGSYQLEMMQKLAGVATSIDLSNYPKPALFYGNRLRGVIIGMRQL
jgi:DNA polymerase III sliding clamp (beta) subunit (PCNA family)